MSANSSSANNQSAESGERSCDQWESLFGDINNYFRDDDILAGSEHASAEVTITTLQLHYSQIRYSSFL